MALFALLLRSVIVGVNVQFLPLTVIHKYLNSFTFVIFIELIEKLIFFTFVPFVNIMHVVFLKLIFNFHFLQYSFRLFRLFCRPSGVGDIIIRLSAYIRVLKVF